MNKPIYSHEQMAALDRYHTNAIRAKHAYERAKADRDPPAFKLRADYSIASGALKTFVDGLKQGVLA